MENLPVGDGQVGAAHGSGCNSPTASHVPSESPSMWTFSARRDIVPWPGAGEPAVVPSTSTGIEPHVGTSQLSCPFSLQRSSQARVTAPLNVATAAQGAVFARSSNTSTRWHATDDPWIDQTPEVVAHESMHCQVPAITHAISSVPWSEAAGGALTATMRRVAATAAVSQAARRRFPVWSRKASSIHLKHPAARATVSPTCPPRRARRPARPPDARGRRARRPAASRPGRAP